MSKRLFQWCFTVLYSFTGCLFWIITESLIEGAITDSLVDNIVMIWFSVISWFLSGFLWDAYQKLGKEKQRFRKDAVLDSLYRLRDRDDFGEVISFHIKDQDLTLNQMITEVEQQTEIGTEFSNNVYDLTLSYMGKFSPDAE